jgi:DNA-binding XRE family transcriptional regulator
MMSTVSQLQRKWRPDHEFRRAYDCLKPEFRAARQLVAARNRAGLTQAQVAGRMGTTQSTIARLESGKRLPTLSSLERYAQAVGCKIQLRLLSRR